MKISVQQIILMVITSVFAVSANAHPGHDHTALSSSAIHAVFYFAIAAVVLFSGYIAFKAMNQKIDSDK